jgi:hypothetical protein
VTAPVDLRALLEAAAPGEWKSRFHEDSPAGWWVYTDGIDPLADLGDADSAERDAALIVAAVNSLPRLLDVVEAARDVDACYAVNGYLTVAVAEKLQDSLAALSALDKQALSEGGGEGGVVAQRRAAHMAGEVGLDPGRCPGSVGRVATPSESALDEQEPR